jgi:hypothetical protein
MPLVGPVLSHRRVVGGIDFSPSCDVALEHPRKYLLEGYAAFGAQKAGLGNVVGCWTFVFRGVHS